MRLEIAELKGLINRGPLQTVYGYLRVNPEQITKRREDRILRKAVKSHINLRRLACRSIFPSAVSNQLFLNALISHRSARRIAYIAAAACIAMVALAATMSSPAKMQVRHEVLQAWRSIGNQV
jgi:hypothetical protein